MNNLDTVYLKNYLGKKLNFLFDFGYKLDKSKVANEEEVVFLFVNQSIGKQVSISMIESVRTYRFFIVIAIIRIPYVSVHDFVSFDVFLEKKGIQHPDAINAKESKLAEKVNYLNDYIDLIKKYGIELISSDKQYPHNFPEWT